MDWVGSSFVLGSGCSLGLLSLRRPHSLGVLLDPDLLLDCRQAAAMAEVLITSLGWRAKCIPSWRRTILPWSSIPWLPSGLIIAMHYKYRWCSPCPNWPKWVHYASCLLRVSPAVHRFPFSMLGTSCCSIKPYLYSLGPGYLRDHLSLHVFARPPWSLSVGSCLQSPQLAEDKLEATRGRVGGWGGNWLSVYIYKDI